jgi:hypothetical protein
MWVRRDTLGMTWSVACGDEDKLDSHQLPAIRAK